jgi:hypothetical protein
VIKGKQAKLLFHSVILITVTCQKYLLPALFFLKKRFWIAKNDPKFRQKGMVLVIPVPGKKGSGTLFHLASI